MKKLIGFLKWQFNECHTSVQFWAFMVVGLGIIARVGGCPGNIPWYIVMTGVTAMILDSIFWVIKWQYRLYQLEQKHIVEKLSKK